MKLGIGIHYYSGGEFLEPLLRNCREVCDYLVVVYSRHSLDGVPMGGLSSFALSRCVSLGLADEFIECDPGRSRDAHRMQRLRQVKNEAAREACVRAGCDWFQLRDADEFYDAAQMSSLLSSLDSDLYICPSYGYVVSPDRRERGLYGTRVCCLQQSQFPYTGVRGFNLCVSLERVPSGYGRWRLLGESDLVCHHFYGVRLNEQEWANKFHGHSALTKAGPDGRESFTRRVREAGYDVVDDRFGILSHWESGVLG